MGPSAALQLRPAPAAATAAATAATAVEGSAKGDPATATTPRPGAIYCSQPPTPQPSTGPAASAQPQPLGGHCHWYHCLLLLATSTQPQLAASSIIRAAVLLAPQHTSATTAHILSSKPPGLPNPAPIHHLYNRRSLLLSPLLPLSLSSPLLSPLLSLSTPSQPAPATKKRGSYRAARTASSSISCSVSPQLGATEMGVPAAPPPRHFWCAHTAFYTPLQHAEGAEREKRRQGNGRQERNRGGGCGQPFLFTPCLAG